MKSARCWRNDALGEEIAALSARLQASDYRLLVLIHEFDEGGGWAQQGAKSCAHWLSWRIGLDAGAAREKLRVAHALGKLPLLSASMSKGEISYSKVRAVTRVATPDNEDALLDIALGATAGQVERIVRAWRKVDLEAEAQHARYQQDHASLTTFVDDDGMTVVRGKLPPDIGSVFAKALEAANDAIYRDDPERTPAQRRAEALRVVSESALAAGVDPGRASDRYQVIVHVDALVLEEPAASGQSALEGGVGVSAETSRRIACDATLVEMSHDREGNVLDVGRKSRTIPTAIRRALDARDPICVWPGCDCRFTQGHHIVFWANGGETRLDNLCNLCSYHHHLVHDGGYRVEKRADGALCFRHPGGWELPRVPKPIRATAPVDEIPLEGWEGQPKWGYEPVDLPWLMSTAYRPRAPS